jgi:short-subunit dehydrogenase
MDLKNKVIVITGASSGIGRELARQLARRKARLALAARSVSALEDARLECEAAGAEAIGIAADVARIEDCQWLVRKTVEHFGRLDVLVNNAGISMVAPFEQITDLSTFARLMEVNYLGAVHGTHFALPHLKQSRGLIVAVSSLQGKTGFPNSTAYAASKHAVQGFFDSLRIELADSGVDVLVVSPGAVATPIHTRRLDASGTVSENGPERPDDKCMPAAECARQIVTAMEQRRRELLMTTAGKLGPWLKLIAPRWTDRLVANAVRDFYSDEKVKQKGQ